MGAVQIGYKMTDMEQGTYGAGSMYERRPGVWLLRVGAGTDPLTGKPIVVSETFKGNKTEATKRRITFPRTSTTVRSVFLGNIGESYLTPW